MRHAAATALLALATACGAHQPASAPADAAAGSAAPHAGAEAAPVATLPTPGPVVPLSTWFGRLRAIEQGEAGAHARLVVFGDSHSASDTWTATLRDGLVGRFGDGGRGFALPGKPWRTFRQLCTDYTMSGSWESSISGVSRHEPPFGLGGVSVTSSQQGARLGRGESRRCRTGGSVDRYRFQVVEQPGGGSVRILVGEQEIAVRSTAADETRYASWTVAATASQPASIELLGDGPVTVVGTVAERDGSGASVEVAAFNGATAAHFLRADVNLWSPQLRELEPSLAVFAFGSNEAYNLDRGLARVTDAAERSRRLEAGVADAAAALARLIARARAAAPIASCLVVLPPDLATEAAERSACARAAGSTAEAPLPAGCSATRATLQPIVEAFEAVARDQGCEAWNQFAAMGGEGAMLSWLLEEPARAQRDGVHLTGRGYRAVGETLSADLLRAYDDWREGRPGRVATSPIPASDPASSMLEVGAEVVEFFVEDETR
jgi:lysophospholipase L1-like esterase